MNILAVGLRVLEVLKGLLNVVVDGLSAEAVLGRPKRDPNGVWAGVVVELPRPKTEPLVGLLSLKTDAAAVGLGPKIEAPAPAVVNGLTAGFAAELPALRPANGLD